MGGPDDLRAQKVMAEILNLALEGDVLEPISFSEGGQVLYRAGGKVVDRHAFEQLVRAQVGSLTFTSRVLERFFWRSKAS